MKIGMIGCDTTHCQHFARMLNDPSAPDYFEGATIVQAFPGGSPDFPLSASRVDAISADLEKKYGVRLVPTLEEAVAGVDAILLESVDGRVHLDQFRACLAAGKPVFIDKPLATSSADAREIARLAVEAQVPFFSASGLRWAEELSLALSDAALGPLYGIDVSGPLAFQPPVPDYFWYGNHTAEMIYRALGAGCREVTVTSTEMQDVIVGVWADGRIGTIRGNRCGNGAFTGTVHRPKGSQALHDAYRQPMPFYHRLMQEILGFFKTGIPPVPVDEMLEVIRFLEAAGESRRSGRPVKL